MDKITIERQAVELAASLIQPLTGKGDREVYEALRAALAAHPAEAQQEPVRDIIEGWKSATFGWNGTNPISYEKARADHAEECIRRIEAALTAQPAECGNTPYDEGPFTLAAQPAEPVAWRWKERVNSMSDSDWTVTNVEPPDGVRVIAKEPLYAAQPAPAAVPPGYALVPIEPTHGMLSALTQEWHPSKHGPMKQRYRAMIAAAGDKP